MFDKIVGDHKDQLCDAEFSDPAHDELYKFEL